MELDPTRLPRHVAVIMDGNGRWAERRGLSRLHGHRVGKQSVRAIVETTVLHHPPTATVRRETGHPVGAS